MYFGGAFVRSPTSVSYLNTKTRDLSFSDQLSYVHERSILGVWGDETKILFS